MAGVSHVGNVVTGDLKEMIRLGKLQQAENEGLKSGMDKMYIIQAEHMLRTEAYEAGVKYIIKAIEVNPDSQVCINTLRICYTVHILKRAMICFTESIGFIGSHLPVNK